MSKMAARLRQFRISALPVLDDDMKVIGVVSEADLLPKEGMDDKTACPASSKAYCIAGTTRRPKGLQPRT